MFYCYFHARQNQMGIFEIALPSRLTKKVASFWDVKEIELVGDVNTQMEISLSSNWAALVIWKCDHFIYIKFYLKKFLFVLRFNWCLRKRRIPFEFQNWISLWFQRDPTQHINWFMKKFELKIDLPFEPSRNNLSKLEFALSTEKSK